MKRLFSMLRRSPKRVSAVVSMLAVAIIVPAAVFAWGPSRPTYTIESPADHVTFNSITNNPNYGDERNFVTIKDASNNNAGGWVDEINAENGKEYYVRMYVHNNAAADLNLTAKNVVAKFNVPSYKSDRIQIDGYLSADNATPKKVWDQAVFSSDSKFEVKYVAGSATYTNNVFTSGTPLPDNLVGVGTKLGYESMDGEIPGCFQYSGLVIFKVKIETSEFDIQKTVRINGAEDKTFKEDVSAKPGQKVDYQIYFNNNGEATLEDVVIKDQLPAHMSYVKGTTYLHNDSGTKQVADGITSNGLMIGTYLSGADAYLKFTAKVADEKDLECGMQTLTNVAKVITSDGQDSDDAKVKVSRACEDKECKPGIPVGDPRCYELPKTGAGEIAGMLSLGAIVAGVGYYINSRRSLGAK